MRPFSRYFNSIQVFLLILNYPIMLWNGMKLLPWEVCQKNVHSRFFLKTHVYGFIGSDI